MSLHHKEWEKYRSHQLSSIPFLHCNLLHRLWRTYSLGSFPTALVISLPTPAQLPVPYSLPTFLLSSFFFPSYLPSLPLPAPPFSVLISHSSFSSPSLWWYWSTSSSPGQSVWASSVKRTSSPSKPWRTFSMSTRMGKTRELIVSCSRLLHPQWLPFPFLLPPSFPLPPPPPHPSPLVTCIDCCMHISDNY